jgi:hypothetical protein
MKRHLKLRASLSERFHDKVMPEPNSGCWLWFGAVKEHGYGVIGLGRRHEGTEKAHRVGYLLYKGEIPEGMNVLHKCDTPACCNPEHLFLGTLKDNSRDCVKKGRNFLPDNRGERATWSKLKEADVREILTRQKTSSEYASQFGVSRSAIAEIWRGKNWACLAA